MTAELEPPHRPARLQCWLEQPDTRWGIALIVLAMVAFATSLFNGFVIDDEFILVDNYAVRRLANLSLFFTSEYFQSFGEASYRPLCTLSYMIDYQVWGLNPFGYHLHNLLLHLAMVLLVYGFLLAWLNNRLVAFVTAGLLAVHTISGEAVNGIGFREDLQAALLMVGGLFCCLKALRTGRWGWIFGVWACVFLAMQAKENGAALPLLLIGLFLIETRPGERARHTHLIGGAVVAFAATMVVRFVLMNNPVSAGELALSGTALEQLLMVLKIQGVYLRALLYLAPFLPDFGAENMTAGLDGSLMAGAGAILGLTAWAALLRRPAAWIAIAFYVVTMLPTSNLHPLNNPIAYRYLYFPALGLYFLVALTVDRLAESYPNNRARLLPICALVLLAPALFTAQWNRHWRNNLELWTFTVSRVQDSSRIWSALASAQLEANLPEEALQSAEKSLAMKRESFFPWIALATAQVRKGEFEVAIQSYLECLKYPAPGPRFRAEAYMGIAYAQEDLGRMEEAAQAYEEAIRLNPRHVGALFNRGLLALRERDRERALDFMQRVIEIDPGNPQANEIVKALSKAP